MRGVIQICISVSGLCVVMWVVVGDGLIFVCGCGSVCNQINILAPDFFLILAHPVYKM